MRDRNGMTALELMVAMTLLVLLWVVGHSGLSGLVRGTGMADRNATRNLVRTQVLERLLQDLRSSVRAVDIISLTEYAIVRHVRSGGRLVQREVRWKQLDGPRVVRQEAGSALQTYSFVGLMDPGSPMFQLRIERATDAEFVP